MKRIVLMVVVLIWIGCLPLVAAATEPLPRLVDVGADKCVPCKLMAPILDELKKEYAGKMSVVFVDAWKDPETAKSFGVQMDGKELYRHTGFYGKEEILGKWRELGYDFPQ